MNIVSCWDIKEIPLSRGTVAVVASVDFEFLNQWKWCLAASRYAARYLGVDPNRQIIYMHREVLAMHGIDVYTQPNMMVDHIDANSLNNHYLNLRIATKAENMRNRGKNANNTTGFKGVSMTRNGKWRAYIKVDGKQKYLGVFDNIRDAAQAYNKFAIIYFGDFAFLNEIID